VEALAALEPCGTECPRPLVCVSGMTVLQAGEVGGGKHLRLRLLLGDVPINAIWFSMTALRAGIAPGDMVEVAGAPQVNEFRGMRSVQLQLTDLRLMEPERSTRDAELQLYQRHRNGEALTADEAAALLPPRADFVTLWKYLRANAEAGVLPAELDCLTRQLARCTGQPVSYMRTRVCLDVFQECGLLSLSHKQDQYEIRIRETEGRVDLNASKIIVALNRCIKGE